MFGRSWKIALLVTLFTAVALAVPPWFMDAGKWFGKPAQWNQGDSASYALWRDAEGWHLRATTKIRARTFSGVIKLKGGKVEAVRPVKLERNDKMLLDNGLESIRFSFTVRHGVDGFNWRWSGNIARFDLYLDGKRIDPGKIFIGSEGKHPSDNPFSFRRNLSRLMSKNRSFEHRNDKRTLTNPMAWQGKPAGWEKGETASVAMWRDNLGWHLRTTTKFLRRRFSGHIRTVGGKVTNIRPVDPEIGDKVKVTGNGSIIDFDFKVRMGIDGFDWTWSGDRLQVILMIDGEPLDTSDIIIGKYGIHPGANPFVFER